MKSTILKLSSYRESLLFEHWQLLKKDQSLLLGILGGFISTFLCAIAWAFVTVISGYQVFIMAAFVGFAVGSAIKISGMAIDHVFRIWGMVLSVIGCMLGNVLSALKIIGNAQDADFFTVLLWLNLNSIMEILPKILSAYDLIIYGIAAFCGYYFAASNKKYFSNYFNKKSVKANERL